MIAKWIKVRVKPEQRQRFLDAIEVDALGSERDEPGCARFNVLRDVEDENVYYFYEVYVDKEAVAAHRAARDAGPAVIGHYHSHPSGVAVPSATDAACAAPDGTLWLIVAGDVARLWIAGPGEGGAVRFAEAMLDIR